MRLTSTTETLTREVHVPDQPHKGVTFSSRAHASSSVTMDFTRWADMRYPNQIVVTISRPEDTPPPDGGAALAYTA